eukprot:253919-Hanusia_phi.AAC.1
MFRSRPRLRSSPGNFPVSPLVIRPHCGGARRHGDGPPRCARRRRPTGPPQPPPGEPGPGNVSGARVPRGQCPPAPAARPGRAPDSGPCGPRSRQSSRASEAWSRLAYRWLEAGKPGVLAP